VARAAAPLLSTESGQLAAGGGGGRAFGGFAPNPQNQFLDKTATPSFGFVYAVTAERRLRIVPATDGFLSVSAAGQMLVSNRALTAAGVTELPLPDSATSVTVVFSAQQITDSILSIAKNPLDAASGTVSDPNPSPASRLVVVIPALPKQ
jgi:hypothetical protein